MKKKNTILFLAAIIFTGIISSASAREINNVQFPDAQTVGAQTLSLNGGGLRTATMLNVKVYVAAFYAPKPLTSEAEVNSALSPLRIDLHYVRSVGQAKVTEAWNWQFEQSVTGNYPAFSKDKDAFVRLFGAITKDEVVTIQTEGNETQVFEDAKFKGSIAGKDFQKAFWSMWFGGKPITPELKKQLLAGK